MLMARHDDDDDDDVDYMCMCMLTLYFTRITNTHENGNVF